MPSTVSCRGSAGDGEGEGEGDAPAASASPPGAVAFFFLRGGISFAAACSPHTRGHEQSQKFKSRHQRVADARGAARATTSKESMDRLEGMSLAHHRRSACNLLARSSGSWCPSLALSLLVLSLCSHGARSESSQADCTTERGPRLQVNACDSHSTGRAPAAGACLAKKI